MTEVFLFQLLYYIAATVMFALGMKFNFYYLSGQKGFRECLSTVIKWYKESELSPEPDSKTNTFMIMSNGCNVVIWLGTLLFIGVFVYSHWFLPDPYVNKYFMN